MLKHLLVMMLLLSTSLSASEKSPEAFAAYVAGLKEEASAKGYSSEFINQVTAEIAYRPTVVKADKNQPERRITLDDYLATRVPDWKVKQAVENYQQHRELLNEIGEKYQVQPRFIVALWGNESNFGRIQGNFDVLSALASLAFEGRRENLFRNQFFAALQILQEGHVEVDRFKGSWAGAMGQSQFMPSSFLSYAVDYDGDGKKNIWSSHADVFASIANFLSSEGWNNEITWGRQVTLTKSLTNTATGLSKQNFLPLSVWQEKGVRRYDGTALPTNDIRASLIMPDGEEGRIYLVYQNFHTLMKWNRSSYFGVAVGYLSDRIKRGD